jgi:hypothetical protein
MSIETIILGQDAVGASELTRLVRVDASHRQSRLRAKRGKRVDVRPN